MGGPGPGDGAGKPSPGAPATDARATDARLKRAQPFKPVLQKYENKALKARVDVLAAHIGKHKKYAMWKSTVAVLQGKVNGVTVRVIATMDVKIHEFLRAHARELLEVGEILAPPPILVDVLDAGKKKAEIKAGTTPIHAEQHAVVYAKEIGIAEASVATNFDGCETCRRFMQDHPDVKHVNLKYDRIQVEQRIRDAKARYAVAEQKLLKLSDKVDKGRLGVAGLEKKLAAEVELAKGKPEPKSIRATRERLEKARQTLAAAEAEFVKAEGEFSQAALQQNALEEELAQKRQVDDAEYKKAHDSSKAAADARMKRHSAHLAAEEQRAAAQKKVDGLRKRHGAKAEAIRRAEAKAEASRQAKDAKAAAKPVKPGARPDATPGKQAGGKQVEKLRRQLAELGAELAAAEQELDRARKSMEALAGADTQAVARTATSADSAKSAAKGLPSSTPAALADDARGLGKGARGLDAASRTGVATAERTGQAVPGTSVARAAATAGKMAKAWAVTKLLGGVAIGFFIPLSRLDLLFELALRLFMWDRERRAKEAREWAGILAFLSAAQEVHTDRIGARYVTAAGTLLWTEANRRLADPQDPERITTWIEKWDRETKWGGFVFARYRGGLMRQSLQQEDDDEPYPVRYFIYGDRSFEFTTYGLASNNEKKVLSRKSLRYNMTGNLFTAGTLLDQKERDPSMDTGTPSYLPEPNREIYIHRDVEAVEFRLKAVLPTPLLTPFDFVIFKCNVLIIEILQFISRFDENYFPTDYPFQDVGGVAVVNYLEDAQFPAPINSAYAHFCLKSLYAMAAGFRRHTHFTDGASLDDMASARLKLARSWVPANEKGGFYSHRRPVYEITKHLRNLTPYAQIDPHVRNTDPDLTHIDEYYLSDCADRIEKDIVRMIGDMLSPVDGRRLLYRYNGAPEP